MMIVEWDNCYSSPCNVKSGVRQGSVLLPILFTARCTLVQSAVLRSHVVCLSVCNVGGL